jgi:hypothetical protein
MRGLCAAGIELRRLEARQSAPFRRWRNDRLGRQKRPRYPKEAVATTEREGEPIREYACEKRKKRATP